MGRTLQHKHISVERRFYGVDATGKAIVFSTYKERASFLSLNPGSKKLLRKEAMKKLVTFKDMESKGLPLNNSNGPLSLIKLTKKDYYHNFYKFL